MAIPLPEPVVVPSTSEKTFPDAWVRELNVTAQDATSGSATFVIYPFNAQTGEVHMERQAPEILSIPLWQGCAEIPEVAAAMAAVLAAVEPIRAWKAAKEAAAAPKPNP